MSKKTTKTIYIVYTENFGEAQFVFDEKLKLIDGWNMNDANYRNEYMSGFLNHLGIEVKTELPEDKKNELLKAAGKKLWGLDMDE